MRVLDYHHDVRLYERADIASRQACALLRHGGRPCDGECEYAVVVFNHFLRVGPPRSRGIAIVEACRALRKELNLVQRPELGPTKIPALELAWVTLLQGQPSGFDVPAAVAFECVLGTVPSGAAVLYALTDDATQVTTRPGLDAQNVMALLALKSDCVEALHRAKALSFDERRSVLWALREFESVFATQEPCLHRRWILEARLAVDVARLSANPRWETTSDTIGSLDSAEALLRVLKSISPTMPRWAAEDRIDPVVAALSKLFGADVNVELLLSRLYPSAQPDSYPDPHTLSRIQDLQDDGLDAA